jgi:hypothetical protein
VSDNPNIPPYIFTRFRPVESKSASEIQGTSNEATFVMLLIISPAVSDMRCDWIVPTAGLHMMLVLKSHCEAWHDVVEMRTARLRSEKLFPWAWIVTERDRLAAMFVLSMVNKHKISIDSIPVMLDTPRPLVREIDFEAEDNG